MGLVLCSGCQMWEPWVTSTLPNGHICAKCTEMQFLKDRVGDLELQLDDLRLVRGSEEVVDRTITLPNGHTCTGCTGMQHLKDQIKEMELQLDDQHLVRESEEVIDLTYREIMTPRPEGSGKWVTVRGGMKNARRVESTPEATTISNRYIVLDAVEGDDLTEDGHSHRITGTEPGTVLQKGKKRNAVVIGDSIVRGTDRRFCEPDRYTRMVCCLPGARVRDVSNRVQSILRGEGEQPDVLIHVGTNDIDKKREEVLKRDYRELGWKLRDRTSRVVISGLLPVPSASGDKNGRIRRMNAWLRGWCRRQGFRFLDHWELFWGRHDLYRKDGLHLNPKGANILAGRFGTALGYGLN